MIKTRLKVTFLLTAMISTLLSSCVKEDLYNPNSTENTIKDFDYLTIQNPILNIDYKVQASVLFDLYSENPMILTSTGKRVINKSIKPIYSAYTDINGKYNERITLPAIVNNLYVVSSGIGVTNLIQAEISEGMIQAIASPIKKIEKKRIETKSKAIQTKSSRSAGFLTLGDWYEEGSPAYLYGDDNPEKRIEIDLAKINEVFTEGRAVNKGYFKKNHIDVKKSASIDLYFIDENAKMNNALMYYCYNTLTEQNLTTEQIKARAIIAFPNVDKYIDFDYFGAGIMEKDAFGLHYFENGVDKGTQFPAGTSIGWILNTNGFVMPNVVEGTMFYSNPNLNPEAKSTFAYEKNHVAIFNTQDLVVMGFEDTTNELLKGDGDCNDAVFALKAYPMDAITEGIPSVSPKDPNTVAYTNTFTGTLCYEDNWPLKGDYDMNDVMVKYNCVLSYNYNNDILFSEDEFKVIWSGANYSNSFGVDYEVPSLVANAKVISADFEPEFAKPVDGTENLTILLCKDARSATSHNTKVATYKLRNTFKAPMHSLSYLPPYNPFILIKGEVELHLPKKAPSGVKSHPELFGTRDDITDINKKTWYRATGYFPFALNIVGDNELYFNKPGHEGVKNNIGIVYPEFSKWVDSYGRDYIDWYKKPIK